MAGMPRTAVIALLALLVGCTPASEPASTGTTPATVGAASTENAPLAPSEPPKPFSPLVSYSENVDKVVTAGSDTVIFNYFCAALTATRCSSETMKRIEAEGFLDGKSVLDLAMSTVLAKLRSPAKAPEKSTDEEFIKAAYLIVLGREADEGGLSNNIAFLESSKDRSKALRGLLESVEFQQRPY